MAGNNPQADPLVPTLVAGHVRSGTLMAGEFAGPTGAIEAPADGSTPPVAVSHGQPLHGKAANARGNSK